MVRLTEQWKPIPGFNYSVSNCGRVRSEKTGRIMALSNNQFGVVSVGMMRDGEQYHRSVPLLVAKAFIKQPSEAFDTPINLDGDRYNNHVDNLAWRPRWFAVKYNRQFREPYAWPLFSELEEIKTGEVCDNSIECSRRYGLLEEDLVLSILNHTYVWPTFQEFRILED